MSVVGAIIIHNKQPERNKMSKKAKAKTIPYLEKWDTRYGLSERIVLRKNGKFVDNTSLTALRNGVKVTTR
jgi:hypothetical protein